MLRGEVRLVDLDPARGSEANKRRPAVVVSNDHANAAAARPGRGVVTVVPLTSNTARVWPFQVVPTAAPGGRDRQTVTVSTAPITGAVDRTAAVLRGGSVGGPP